MNPVGTQELRRICLETLVGNRRILESKITRKGNPIIEVKEQTN